MTDKRKVGNEDESGSAGEWNRSNKKKTKNSKESWKEELMSKVDKVLLSVAQLHLANARQESSTKVLSATVARMESSVSRLQSGTLYILPILFVPH